MAREIIGRTAERDLVAAGVKAEIRGYLAGKRVDSPERLAFTDLVSERVTADLIWSGKGGHGDELNRIEGKIKVKIAFFPGYKGARVDLERITNKFSENGVPRYGCELMDLLAEWLLPDENSVLDSLPLI